MASARFCRADEWERFGSEQFAIVDEDEGDNFGRSRIPALLAGFGRHALRNHQRWRCCRPNGTMFSLTT